ncbi:uncharacterized protein [Drosophila bipectinata]|uniref:uncharacterized protein n=1 Tax=Drosophila bipectinata TaxID=42026 RepID=UPI001C8A76EF|nr:uncharacterized protein LOC108123378 [Drosophila bipectinata]
MNFFNKTSPLLNRKCLQNKIQELAPFLKTLEWGYSRDSLFRASWSYYAGDCRERLSNIRRNVQQNARLLASKGHRNGFQVSSDPLYHLPSDLQMEEYIFQELMTCFREPGWKDLTKKSPFKIQKTKKNVGPTPEKWFAWNQEIQDLKKKIIDSSNPYEMEELRRRLSQLYKLVQRPIMVAPPIQRDSIENKAKKSKKKVRQKKVRLSPNPQKLPKDPTISGKNDLGPKQKEFSIDKPINPDEWASPNFSDEVLQMQKELLEEDNRKMKNEQLVKSSSYFEPKALNQTDPNKVTELTDIMKARDKFFKSEYSTEEQDDDVVPLKDKTLKEKKDSLPEDAKNKINSAIISYHSLAQITENTSEEPSLYSDPSKGGTSERIKFRRRRDESKQDHTSSKAKKKKNMKNKLESVSDTSNIKKPTSHSSRFPYFEPVHILPKRSKQLSAKSSAASKVAKMESKLWKPRMEKDLQSRASSTAGQKISDRPIEHAPRGRFSIYSDVRMPFRRARSEDNLKTGQAASWSNLQKRKLSKHKRKEHKKKEPEQKQDIHKLKHERGEQWMLPEESWISWRRHMSLPEVRPKEASISMEYNPRQSEDASYMRIADSFLSSSFPNMTVYKWVEDKNQKTVQKISIPTTPKHGWPISPEDHPTYTIPYVRKDSSLSFEELITPQSTIDKEPSREKIENVIEKTDQNDNKSLSFDPSEVDFERFSYSMDFTFRTESPSQSRNSISSITNANFRRSGYSKPINIDEVTKEFMKKYSLNILLDESINKIFKPNELDYSSVTTERSRMNLVVPPKRGIVAQAPPQIPLRKFKMKRTKKKKHEPVEIPQKTTCSLCQILKKKTSELRPYMQKMIAQRQQLELRTHYTQMLLNYHRQNQSEAQRQKKVCTREVLTSCFQTLLLCENILAHETHLLKLKS